jgi:hypothetical protein
VQGLSKIDCTAYVCSSIVAHNGIPSGDCNDGSLGNAPLGHPHGRCANVGALLGGHADAATIDFGWEHLQVCIDTQGWRRRRPQYCQRDSSKIGNQDCKSAHHGRFHHRGTHIDRGRACVCACVCACVRACVRAMRYATMSLRGYIDHTLLARLVFSDRGRLWSGQWRWDKRYKMVM